MSDMNEPKTFHERLAWLIGKEKPYAWAKKHGITKGKFQYVWENQHGKMPKAELIKEICQKTGVTIDWLVSGKGDAFKESRTVISARCSECGAFEVISNFKCSNCKKEEKKGDKK